MYICEDELAGVGIWVVCVLFVGVILSIGSGHHGGTTTVPLASVLAPLWHAESEVEKGVKPGVSMGSYIGECAKRGGEG